MTMTFGDLRRLEYRREACDGGTNSLDTLFRQTTSTLACKKAKFEMKHRIRREKEQDKRGTATIIKTEGGSK